MHIGQIVAGRVASVLCLGILLGTLVLPVQAEDRATPFRNGGIAPSGGVPLGVPQAGRPLSSPPVFMDRAAPMSERPFARPFIDRSSPMSERPLAPIGDGAQLAPGSAPLIWCQGEWGRANSPGHSCSPR